MSKATSSKKSFCPTPKPGDTGGNPPSRTNRIMNKRLTASQMQKRNDKIRKMYYSSDKYSVRSLAEKVGLSKSRIGEII